MKTKLIKVIDVPESENEQYQYPMWSPDEEETLKRWYSVIGVVQCVELWHDLTGRGRVYKQIEMKAQRMGLQNNIPNDWLELFED